MQRPKRTVSSLNAQTSRLARLGLTVATFVDPHAIPDEGEQVASYSASSLRTISWFPGLSAGERSIFPRYNTACRQKLCPPPAFSSPVAYSSRPDRARYLRFPL